MATASDPVRFSVFDGLAGRFVRPLRLAAVAWLAVFTVLVCAVVPAGLPLTAAQGSAFNPATTAVALQAKAPQTRLLVKRLSEPDGGDAPIAAVPSSASIPAAGLVVAPPARGRHFYGSTDTGSLAAAALEALPWARGPPAA